VFRVGLGKEPTMPKMGPQVGYQQSAEHVANRAAALRSNASEISAERVDEIMADIDAGRFERRLDTALRQGNTHAVTSVYRILVTIPADDEEE
jgi:hypothetical protein